MRHELDNYPDRTRQLLEIAYSCGRGWQSSQTGYIHFCYTILDEDYHHPIPVYENLLFALTLMRTRSVENVNEGKDLLSRLLSFQNLEEGFSEGNFPIYLHEYPHCRDRYQAQSLLPVFYWIHKHFAHILGSELKQRLEKALNNVLLFSLKTNKDRELPYPLAMKVAASAKAVGHLLTNKSFEEQGEHLLLKLKKENSHHSNSVNPAWLSPSGIADLLVAFQMIYPSLPASPEGKFWEHLTATWHRPSETYCGPGWHEYQKGGEPQQTLYDFFLGYYSGKYSYRSFINHPVQLQAVLVNPTQDELPVLAYPSQSHGNVDQLPWQVGQNEKYAYSLIAKPLEVLQTNEKGFHSLKLNWGGGCFVHSMVYQPSAGVKVDYKIKDEEISLFVTLDPVIPNEKNQEIALYVDLSENLRIKVNESPSTTFQLNDLISLRDEAIKMSLSFHLHEGNGEFFGHIMRGNRPSQMDQKGAHRFNAYDWLLFVRSIRRDERCVLEVKIKVT